MIFKGIVKWESEDNGVALIAHLESSDENNPMFVRLQSWDESKVHAEASSLTGRKVRLTLELEPE